MVSEGVQYSINVLHVLENFKNKINMNDTIKNKQETLKWLDKLIENHKLLTINDDKITFIQYEFWSHCKKIIKIVLDSKTGLIYTRKKCINIKRLD